MYRPVPGGAPGGAFLSFPPNSSKINQSHPARGPECSGAATAPRPTTKAIPIMMDFFLQTDNLILEGVILVSAAGLMLPLFTKKLYAPAVSPKAVIDLINKEDAVVIDVRGAAEFKRGHIAKARNVPADQMAKAVSGLDKARPVVLCDQSGAVARMVSRLLKSMGFEKVYLLEGGIDAWKKENLPLA